MSYVAPWSVTDDDKRTVSKMILASTVCRRASNIFLRCSDVLQLLHTRRDHEFASAEEKHSIRLLCEQASKLPTELSSALLRVCNAHSAIVYLQYR